MSVYKGTTLIAGIPDISGKANIDMNNLTSTGKNIGNWSSNVTNCITDIPQDIKIELNSGTLTLKAGSKSYMPNGVGVFTEVTNSADLTYTPTWGAGYQCFITGYVNSNGTLSGIGMCRADLAFSGTTAPSTTTGGSIWYDTSANKIKVYRSGAWVVDSTSEPRTLFLGIITVGTGNVITSIDQVFNGFGYIGSTMFALPGVKGLIPNGRNEDGTLKNTEITLSNVVPYTFSNYNSKGMWLGISSTEIMANNRFVSQEENPQTTYTTWYRPSENINYYSSGTTTFSKLNYVVFGQMDRTAGSSMPTLSNFRPKTVFHAVDYNDFRTVVETYTNGKSWYRIWSDGWIEQGGYATSGTISLLKTYTNANYAIKVTPVGTNSSAYFDKGFVVTGSPTTTQFNVLGQVVNAWYWQTAGY